MRVPILALAFVALLAAGFAHARADVEDLGRLFLTPDKRAALERQRQVNVQRALVMEGSELRVDGIIRRSGGHSTVWINGIAHHDGQPASEVRSRIDPRDPSRVTLAVGDEAPAQLRVGEALNRATRERRDGLKGGRVGTRGGGLQPPPGGRL